ncbi:MAG TPA: HYR domain-containing protein, partial [Phycisphaerae bacterium]|nr:HYR domain-containing protein [Phycisphaerae bacterium]
ITRTWTATDACGNTADCAQTIATVDETAPVITCPADQLGLPCGSDTSVAATGEATATDECGSATVTYADDVTADCGDAQTITRTWTATDACGNAATCVQTISTEDNTAPTITCPADQLDLACNADTSPAGTGTATGTDDCGDVTVTYADVDEPACGATGVVMRTWTATDACGNTAECTQTVATVDETAPVLTVDTTPIVVADADCSGDEAVTLPVASATDDCGDVTVTNDAPGTFPAGETTTVTYTAEDECGNTASESLDVTVEGDSTIAVDARRFIVGLGHHPGITQEPLDNIEVCAYERGGGSCALAECGILYLLRFGCILDNCAPVACATTDANGYAELNVPPGKYVVISDDATQLVLPTPLGGVVEDLGCGETELVRLRQIEIATGRRLACRITRLTGSELLILEPEEILWDDTEQLYPFVFESVGDWDVTVEVTPPDGFVADYNELSEEVDNNDKAVQFTITEVGSDLVPTQTRFNVFHKGRQRVVQSKVGIALTAEYARSRGFDVRKLKQQGLIKEVPLRERVAAPAPTLESIQRP